MPAARRVYNPRNVNTASLERSRNTSKESGADHDIDNGLNTLDRVSEKVRPASSEEDSILQDILKEIWNEPDVNTNDISENQQANERDVVVCNQCLLRILIETLVQDLVCLVQHPKETIIPK